MSEEKIYSSTPDDGNPPQSSQITCKHCKGSGRVWTSDGEGGELPGVCGMCSGTGQVRNPKRLPGTAKDGEPSEEKIYRGDLADGIGKYDEIRFGLEDCIWDAAVVPKDGQAFSPAKLKTCGPVEIVGAWESSPDTPLDITITDPQGKVMFQETMTLAEFWQRFNVEIDWGVPEIEVDADNRAMVTITPCDLDPEPDAIAEDRQP